MAGAVAGSVRGQWWRCRVLLGVGAGAVGLLVAACASSAAPAAGGEPMMGAAPSGYQFSRLSRAAPSSLPGRVVTVTLADMGMSQMMGGTAPLGVRMMLRATPTSVPTGQVSLVAANLGWRTHELVILPLSNGASAGQRVPGSDATVDETGSLGEASTSCAAGAGDGIAAGTVGWVTVSLSPGRYELACNLPNHYADGMYQELDVS